MPHTESQIPKREDLENLLDKVPPSNRPLQDLYEVISILRFRPDKEENLLQSTSRILILLTFPTWKSTDDAYYYNILRNKGLAKRKVTFGQTITTPPSNLLSGKQPRY